MTSVWVRQIGKLGLFVQFNIILNKKTIPAPSIWSTKFSSLIQGFDLSKIAFTFVQETFTSPEALVWKFSCKASPARLTIFPERLKLMSKSEEREQGGEKVVQRPDKGWDTPVVKRTAMLWPHNPADAAY